MTVVSK